MQPIVSEHQFHTELFLYPIWIEDWGKNWHLPRASHVPDTAGPLYHSSFPSHNHPAGQ